MTADHWPARDSTSRLGAIDIGSNSVRLVIAQVFGSGEYRILDEERITTRLARSLGSTGRLSEASIDATIETLGRFQKIASGYGVSSMRTIATCAVREAENREEFAERVRSETGLEMDVIGPLEEAQFAYRSVQQAFDISERTVVIADIGGGSTEVILAANEHVQEIYSTPLGAVRMTELYGPPEGLFPGDYGRMLKQIRGQVKEHMRKPALAPQVLIGSGGTFTTMAAILMADRGQTGQPEWGYRASHADLQKMTLKERRGVPGLSADRADIIVAGLAVIDAIMARFKVNTVQVHNRGVRDGLLLTMIEELHPERSEISREVAVERFAASCGVDLEHARHVMHLAVSIFDQLVEPLGLDPRDRSILETAAIVQDVGYLINYDKHHKHSYHLILNSQLPGCRRHELELIANVARYHRGARPKKKHENFRRLSKQDQQKVKQLVAILRVAGGLDRSHRQLVRNVKVKVTEGAVQLTAMTRDDPEVDVWATRSRAKLFEKIFDLTLEVVAKPVARESVA